MTTGPDRPDAPGPGAPFAEALASLSAPPRLGGAHVLPAGATSDLSVDETLVLHSIGWEAVDLVFGVAWWSIPWGVWQWQTGEIDEATQAFAGAMHEASDQLAAECRRAAGAGVIGVAVELAVHSRHVAVSLSGTAVRPIGGKGADAAFLSDLSARDFSLLARAGWLPLGLVAGASFVVAPRRSARQWAAQQGQNTEMPHLTEALYLARERAMEQLQRSGRQRGADGVVGVKLREGPLSHSARILQFVAVGTAVRVAEGGHRSITPTMVVSLDDPVRMFAATSLRRTPT